MDTPEFHLGIATDPICADWKAISTTLEYLTRNRRAAGDTITLHDITPWGSTKLAMLWGTANFYPVCFTEDRMHLQLNSAVAILDDLRSRRQLDALVIFWNEPTPAHDNISSLRAQIGITARNINEETKQLIAHSQQHGIPTRVIPFDDRCNTHAPSYPIVVVEHGTSKSPNPGLRTGRFYAPCATQHTALHWLANSMDTSILGKPMYTIDTLELNGGWWNYSMHRN